MLKITVQMPEFYDETKEEFVWDEVELELEHSLLSLSKWESEFEKPFLVPDEKTDEEVMAYVRCMILTPDYPPGTLEQLSRDPENLQKIHDYWNAKMTGSSVPESKGPPPRTTERISSELIYYWMTKYEIPWEAQTWHLSRLFMLIKIFGVKDAPKDKKTTQQSAADRRAENARRRAAAGSKG